MREIERKFLVDAVHLPSEIFKETSHGTAMVQGCIQTQKEETNPNPASWRTGLSDT